MCLNVASSYLVQKTVSSIDSLENVSTVSSFHDIDESSGSSRYLSSRITNYDHNTIGYLEEPSSQVTIEANPISDDMFKKGPIDEVLSEMEKEKQQALSVKDDLLTLLMYRIFGHATEGTGESQEEANDVDDELNTENYHPNAENTAALLRMFDRLLSEGETEDGVNPADNDLLKSYLIDKIRSLEGDESEEGLEENSLDGDKTEVNPDDVIEADRKGFLSLVKLLGYIPNNDPDLCGDVDPKERSTESESNRQKVEGTR